MTESLHILLKKLIDYAGLFPPATLPMQTSIASFKAYRASEPAWMLNRFVLPVARLNEFLGLFEEAGDSATWDLSATVGADVETEVAAVVEFNRHIFKEGACAVIRSVEIKANNAEVIRQYRRLIPESVDAYFELTGAQNGPDSFDRFIAILAECDAYAKLRTGGDRTALYPSSAEVAHFLAACAFANVPFKCSAGLHHPIRSTHRDSDDPNAPSAEMHGLLNVFVAAALAQIGAATSEIEAALEEASATAFHFERSGIRWRDHFIANDELASARSTFCLSFGSCSFTQSLDDLATLGLL